MGHKLSAVGLNARALSEWVYEETWSHYKVLDCRSWVGGGSSPPADIYELGEF